MVAPRRWWPNQNHNVCLPHWTEMTEKSDDRFTNWHPQRIGDEYFARKLTVELHQKFENVLQQNVRHSIQRAQDHSNDSVYRQLGCCPLFDAFCDFAKSTGLPSDHQSPRWCNHLVTLSLERSGKVASECITNRKFSKGTGRKRHIKALACRQIVPEDHWQLAVTSWPARQDPAYSPWPAFGLHCYTPEDFWHLLSLPCPLAGLVLEHSLCWFWMHKYSETQWYLWWEHPGICGFHRIILDFFSVCETEQVNIVHWPFDDRVVPLIQSRRFPNDVPKEIGNFQEPPLLTIIQTIQR